MKYLDKLRQMEALHTDGAVVSEDAHTGTLKNLKNPDDRGLLGSLGAGYGIHGKTQDQSTPVRAFRWIVRTHTGNSEVWLSPPGTADDAMLLIDDAVTAEPDRWLSVGCATCSNLAQPGLAEPGYCGQRTDLPHAYGPGHPLHLLPDDRGATCQQWERIE